MLHHKMSLYVHFVDFKVLFVSKYMLFLAMQTVSLYIKGTELQSSKEGTPKKCEKLENKKTIIDFEDMYRRIKSLKCTF